MLLKGQTWPLSQSAFALQVDGIAGKSQHIQVLGVYFFIHGCSVRESPI
jgi:hypothetical protein